MCPKIRGILGFSGGERVSKHYQLLTSMCLWLPHMAQIWRSGLLKKFCLFLLEKSIQIDRDVHQVLALYDLKEQSYRPLKIEVYNRSTGKPSTTEKLPGIATIIGKGGEKKSHCVFQCLAKKYNKRVYCLQNTAALPQIGWKNEPW